ncbi:MAG TPA: hypothetical protein PLT07_10170, partial [Trueperaceae bacterium]|nr:hypothetical protein [Trueperaceae bacterium]
TSQASNRFVRKGGKGIAILAPLLVCDPEDRDQLNLAGFKTVYVFDLAQADGEPIPQREGPRLLIDTARVRAKLAGLHFRLAVFCASQGVCVLWDFQHEHALGVYRPTDKQIAIRSGHHHT